MNTPSLDRFQPTLYESRPLYRNNIEEDEPYCEECGCPLKDSEEENLCKECQE